ncbi:ComGF family competence protein [Metabacillus sp. GX 13764]|uniref:competence type IV pilus minor pilin ComGF n=1 Tax=Metabacillus kandeliae TaxID=2900151 RepID=UPI001E352FBE|nr:ComGF family competence protein [Metabacillus kandeliae]
MLYGKKSLNAKENIASRCRNSRGYTLLNMLFALGVFTIIVSSMLPLISFLLHSSQKSGDLSAFEWEVFSEQLSNEIRQGKQFSVTAEGIDFTNPSGQRVSITRYNDLVRRQVGGKGHEIMLQQIKSIRAEITSTGLAFNLVSKANVSYHLSIPLFQNLKGNTYE